MAGSDDHPQPPPMSAKLKRKEDILLQAIKDEKDGTLTPDKEAALLAQAMAMKAEREASTARLPRPVQNHIASEFNAWKRTYDAATAEQREKIHEAFDVFGLPVVRCFIAPDPVEIEQKIKFVEKMMVLKKEVAEKEGRVLNLDEAMAMVTAEGKKKGSG